MSGHDLIRAAITAELEGCSQRVSALIAQAQSLSEREVLAAGARIDEMHREAEGNLESLKRVGRQLEASDAAVRATTRQSAAALEGYTQRLSEGMARQRACTGAVTDVARKITAFVVGVDRVSVELRMLTLNARLEAARWGSQGAAFATVASSMGELTGEVSKANKQIGDLASELSAIAARVAESQQAMEALSEGLTGDVQGQMAALSGAYDGTRQASSEAVSSGVLRAGRLVELSNAVLTNLQFQDRLSQVLREAEVVVLRAGDVTAKLFAAKPDDEVSEQTQAAIDDVLAGTEAAVLRISGESELAASDASLASGEVELF